MRGQAAPRRAGATASGSAGTRGSGAGAAGIALAHHHPAHIFENGLAALVEAARADIDDAALAVGVFLQTDDLRSRVERVAGIDRLQEAAVGVAEIGDRVERDVGHRLAEHDMKGEQIVDRACGIADGAGEGLGALRRRSASRRARNRATRRRRVQRARRRMARSSRPSAKSSKKRPAAVLAAGRSSGLETYG